MGGEGGRKVGVGDLLATFDVIEDDDAIVVDIDTVDEGVDDVTTEIRVEEIAGAEALQPGAHFVLRKTYIMRDTEFGKVGFDC